MLPKRLIALLWDAVYADETLWTPVGPLPDVGPFSAVAAMVFTPGARAAAVHVAGSKAAEVFVPGAQATEVYP